MRQIKSGLTVELRLGFTNVFLSRERNIVVAEEENERAVNPNVYPLSPVTAQ